MNLSSKLKKLSWLYRLNALYKSVALKQKYRATVSRYSKMPAIRSFKELIRHNSIEKLRNTLLDRPLRILFLGTDEQQDRSGILQALEKISDLAIFTRADGSYGQNDPSHPLLRKRANTNQLWTLIEAQVAQGKTPDVLIAQTWACLIDPEVFSSIREAYGTFVIIISMDDRHQYFGEKINGKWGGTYALIPHVDLVLTAAPECVDWYMKEGCPALFFPEASDPEIFHPMLELPKIHDVCFVGGRYGIREQIVNALRNVGIHVAAYGGGWEGGRIDTEFVPKLFAQSKIILGVGTIGHCSDLYALKLRDFDAPMSGSLYLTHDNPDLELVYDIGREIVTYSDIQGCVNMARYFLKNDKEREKIALQGRLRASSEHTWKNRFDSLMMVLNQH